MEQEALYRKHAKWYDAVYSHKDYVREVRFVDEVIKKCGVKGRSVLDVACGTGNHAKLLVKKRYLVIGIDKNPEILAIARKKNAHAKFKQGDMRTFRTGKKYDIITCLFTAINYNTRVNDLVQTLKNFKQHLNNDGIIIFDFPLHKKPTTNGAFPANNLAVVYDNRDVGKVREITIYWLFKTKGTHATVDKDMHRIRLYSLKEYATAINRAGLTSKVYWDWTLTKKKGQRAVIVCQKV